MIGGKNGLHVPRYRIEWRDIWALMPIYLSDGTNGSQIYYVDGTIEQSRARLSWVLDDLLACQCSSREILQQQSRRLLERLGQPQQKRLPLLLTPDFALMPVKARSPHSRHHTANGYVVYTMIAAIQENPDGAGSIILLKNGQQLFVLDRVRTLRENMQMMEQLVEARKNAHIG